MALSYADLQGLWIKAGGSAEAAPIMAAIALAESGGNPTAHNPVPPDDSYGLWQINMLGQMGVERKAAYGLSSYTDLYDPLTNAKAAVAIGAGGKNFIPWSTYTNGAYKNYMQGGVPPNLNVDGGGGTANVGLPSPEEVVVTVWNGAALIGNYIYFTLLVLGGVLLMAIGVVMLTKETGVASVAGAVGKAAKVVNPL